MKTKMRKSTFPRMMPRERIPAKTGCEVSPSQPESVAKDTQGRGFQPPRKSSVKTAEPTSMFEYSATKKSDHLKAPYSVWKPPTRSASDSGMSKGWRLVSAKSEIRKMMADTGMRKMNHAPPQKPGWDW